MYGYYLVVLDGDGEPMYDVDGNPTPLGDVVELPAPVWGSEIGKARSGVVFETELGRRYVFRQFTRRTYKIPFLIFPEELEIFDVLDQNVDGDRDPFLFVIDINVSPQELVFVRKIANFAEGTESVVMHDGTATRMVEHMLEISEEPIGREIAD